MPVCRDREGIGRLETLKKYYRIDRARIAHVRFVLEAYEGIAIMTTVDPRRGGVRIAVAPGCQTELDGIMTDLKRKILIESLDSPSEKAAAGITE